MSRREETIEVVVLAVLAIVIAWLGIITVKPYGTCLSNSYEEGSAHAAESITIEEMKYGKDL